MQVHSKNYLEENNFDDELMKEIVQIFNKGLIRLGKVDRNKSLIFSQIDQSYKAIPELR